MEGMITEIDNKFFMNMKNLSYAKYNNKIVDKMRNKKVSDEELFKKISSDSMINPKSKSKEIINKKLVVKPKSSLREKIIYSDRKEMNNTTSMFSKRLIIKDIVKNFYNKGANKDDTSTSLSTLIKTNTSFFNTSNFNFNTDRKKLTMINVKTIIKNNRKKENFKQQNSFTISFNKYINEYIQRNFLHKNNFSINKFLEAIRIMRKEKIINEEINKKLLDMKENETEEINKYEQFEFFIKNHQKYFLIYFEGLKQYLRELLNIKRKEQDYLAQLKFEKEDLKRIIIKKTMSIKTIKEKLVNMKELKKFLLQVKFGKSLEQLPKEIKEEYDFVTPEQKEKERRKKRRRTTGSIQKNIMMVDPFKRKIFSPGSKKKENNRHSIKEKRIQIINNPIFDNTEQFVSCYNFKTERIKQNLTLYWKNFSLTNEYKKDYRKICSDNERYKKLYLFEEEKLLRTLNFNKKRNIILQDNLKNLIETNKNKQKYLKNIAMKLKKILLNIESKIDKRKCIKEKNLEKFLKYQSEIFKNKEDTFINSNYMLKLIELIALKIVISGNKIKNDEKTKDFYKEAYAEIDQEKIKNRYKYQLSLDIKKEEEKNRNLFNKIAQKQILSTLKNGKKCYKERIPDKILLKRKLEIRKAKKLLNIYEKEEGLFSYS